MILIWVGTNWMQRRIANVPLRRLMGHTLCFLAPKATVIASIIVIDKND